MICSVEHIDPIVASQIVTAAQVDRQRTKDLKVRRIQNAVCVPISGYAGLYENEKAINYTYFNRQLPVLDHFSVTGLQGVGEIDEPVFFLGKYNICWGHCITDGLKFLWPFLDLDKHPYLRNCKVVYTTLTHDEDLPKNFRDLLGLFGIDERRIVRLKRVTALHDCYLADECFWAEGRERHYSPEYCDLIQMICNRCLELGSASPVRQKIYLSRRAWHCDWVTGEFGEKYLEEAFRAVGFEVVYPECIPFYDFVKMMQQAKEVAATECSSSHNALFMSAGAKIILLRKLGDVNRYQLTINQVAKLVSVYVDVGRTVLYTYPKMHQRGPFFMYVTRELAAYLGIKSHFPVMTFIKYIVHVLYEKAYRSLYNFAYRSYKLFFVRWLGITRWEKGKIV